jgi:N-methylhydantoinase A
MRYGEQVFEIDVSLDGLDWAAPDLLGRVHEQFHRRHEDLYTYAMRDQEVVFINARVAAIGEVPPLQATGAPILDSPAMPVLRRAHFGAWREVPVYRVERLSPGAAVEGPAIFEAETTTVIVNAGDHLSVNDLGWLDIRLGASQLST